MEVIEEIVIVAYFTHLNRSTKPFTDQEGIALNITLFYIQVIITVVLNP